MSDEFNDVSKSDLIKALLLERQKRTIVDKSSITRKLKNHHAQYTKEQQKFNSGDLVVWKTGLKNKKMPPEGVPAIVIEHLHSPIIANEENHGSAYFREPLDLIAGFVDDEDGDFVIFHFDSKRFEKYDEV